MGALALVAACDRDRAPETGSATVTGGSTPEAKPVTVEEVRTAIIEQNPARKDMLSSVVITSENGIVTLKGSVPDDETRTGMVNRVKKMPNVKGVRDELTVMPKAAQTAQPMDEPSKGGTMSATPSSNKTKTTDAIRAGLAKDKAAPKPVLDALVVTDDGTTVTLGGTVPNDKTHDALLKSAKKSAGNEHVQDNLHVSGK